MVSYPESGDRAKAPPPPASTSSRLSHSSRRHRHGRSHHGGSSYNPQNEFPIFAHTGDVEIVIAAKGQEKRYLLHRLILSQCSGFFEASTSEDWARYEMQKESSASAVLDSDPSLQSIAEDGSSIVSRRGSAQGTSPRLRWRYELDWQNRESDEEPILVQKVSDKKEARLGFMC
jgi:hypothetical protein